jgi:hypothetical protein
MRPQSAPLRFIATRLRVPDLPQVVREPGTGEAFRITVQYHDARHPDQVATLSKSHASPTVSMVALQVVYRRASDNPLTLQYEIEVERYQRLGAALRRINFDALDDPPDVPYFGADLWLVERAAGSFHHDVILPPAQAAGVYADIVALIHSTLREAIRAINP